jgi:hypothetical protein
VGRERERERVSKSKSYFSRNEIIGDARMMFHEEAKRVSRQSFKDEEDASGGAKVRLELPSTWKMGWRAEGDGEVHRSRGCRRIPD